jgi:SAM-dependent methyltransferase
MQANPYSYFDETYFQDGGKRGTAYVNYKEGARNNPVYREIAVAVREVFQPHRVLEIGCATGIIVRHLNELGCDAHGIDVSEWAVRNAEHPNVKLASADSLPYPDRYFDLVLSCHSLEHMPDSIFNHALAEISRVASGFQFHMLPIVGVPPYDGDPAVVRQNLRKDPTHQQLHEFSWWIEQFRKHRHLAVETCLLFKNDSPGGELSACQFITEMDGSLSSSDVLRRAAVRNQRIFRETLVSANGQEASRISVKGTGRLSFRERIWNDVESRLSPLETLNLTGRMFQLVVIVDGSPCALRFAAGQDAADHAYAHVGEFHLIAQPGCNVFRFSTDHLKTLRGNPDYSKINHLALGGENENAEVLFYFSDQHGAPVLG